MSRKVTSIMLVIVLALSLVFTAGCGTGASNGKVKVGFVFIGPIKDGGWTEAHYNGMNYLKEQLKVETMYRELVPEGPESKKAIKELINAGCNVIFTTSFGYMDPTLEAAKENPKVKFFHCSGFKTAENMSNYFGRMYEPRYLSGIVAGLKTKTNKIGYVAAYEIPEVINGINAFTLGVQSVNPNAVVKVRWSHTWIDSALEKAAAVALLDDGCDVITQHNDSTATYIAAQERGAYAIGYNLDMPSAAPKAYMTAPVWNWGVYYVQEVKAIMEGTWKAAAYQGGIKEGLLDLAPLTEVAPPEAKAKVEEARKQIIDGTLQVFKGPIKDQSGNIKVPEGKTLNYEDTMSMDMNWFVQGVEGKIEVQK
ncbi:MAG: BMP family ABC transporter substrate-binding protein [Clostridia bacterium]|nr:BMP family ABC transporter substrate-binding protein [Clostridia bacterium]